MLGRQGSTAATGRAPERRLDVRYVGPVSGCYTLSDHQKLEDGGIEVYACRTQSISPSAAAITAPVVGAEGEWLTARFDGLGIVRGWIERVTRDGFVFQIVGSEEQRHTLAAKIDWLKKKSVRLEQDKREFKRFQPRDPRSTLALEAGTVVKCFVIDLSRSGAAVSAPCTVTMGDIVVLGVLRARVVRPLAVGFAVQFDERQDAAEVEALVTGYELAKDKASAVKIAAP